MAEIDKSQIELYREKPSEFVRDVIDVEPYPYQEEFLDHPSDRKVKVAGRQTGKTTVMSWMAVHEFVMYPDRGIMLLAPTKRQAINFMRKLKQEIAEWIKNPETQEQYGISYVSKTRLEAKNGSWIQAFPAVDHTIRGFTIHSAFVDEAAFVPRQIFTSVVSPMLATTDGQFVLGSTAWGQEGYLYDKFENDDYWLSHRVTSMENPDIPARQVDEWRRDMTEMEFDREILAQFSDKQNAFFKTKDIQKCLEWAADNDPGSNIIYPDQKSRSAFLGVDPASTGDDEAVLTSIDANGRVFDIQVIPECEIPELEGEIRDLIEKNDRNYIEILIEENGLGEGTVQRFAKEFRQVEGFLSTIRSKESVYNQAKNLMQKGEIRLPDRDDLLRQLRGVEYEKTPRGNTKIHAPEGKHDDMADSFVLAVAAMTGDTYVERQDRAYTFSTSSAGRKKEKKGPRAYSFG